LRSISVDIRRICLAEIVSLAGSETYVNVLCKNEMRWFRKGVMALWTDSLPDRAGALFSLGAN
jgi:hypothetical protein